MMNELAYPNTGILHSFNNPVRAKNFLSFEPETLRINPIYSRPRVCVSQELFRTQKDCIMEKELEYFDRIFQEHSERQTRILNQKVAHPSSAAEACFPKMNCKEPTDATAVDPLLEKLQERKVNLVLVATSLNETDVVKKLESTLDPANSSMIPLTFDDNTNGSISNQTQQSSRPCTDSYEINVKSSEHDAQHIALRRVSDQGKNERYWKRRTSNNEAAKKSRDARKARFEWIESRVEELEAQNASLREQLKTLTQIVSEKEGKV